MATIETLTYDITTKVNLTSLKSLTAGFAKITAVVGVANVAITAFTNAIAKANLADVKLAQSLGVTTNEFLNLQNAFKLAGEDGNNVASVLNNLTNNIAEFKDVGTGLNVGAFARFGIDIKKSNGELKTATELMYAVSDAIKDIDDVGMQRRILSETLGDDTLLYTLRQGSSVIRDNIELSQKLGDLQSSNTEKLTLEYTKQKNVFSQLIGSVKGTVGDTLLENLSSGLQVINKMILDNKVAIEQVLTTLATGANKAFNLLFNAGTRVVNLFSNIVTTFGGIENVAKVALATFTILQRRLIATLAIFTAIFLVIEDIFKGLQGKDSYTADIFGTENLKSFNDFLGKINLSIGDLLVGLAAAKVAMTALKGLGGFKGLTSISKVASTAIGGVTALIGGATALTTGAIVKSGYDTIKSGGGIGDFLAGVGKNFGSITGLSKLDDMGERMIAEKIATNNQNNNTTNNITVNVNSPQEASEFIRNHNVTDTLGSV